MASRRIHQRKKVRSEQDQLFAQLPHAVRQTCRGRPQRKWCAVQTMALRLIGLASACGSIRLTDARPCLFSVKWQKRARGGYFAHFRAHRHICMARLDISIRIRHTFSSRPPAFLPTRRNARRDGYRAVRARCVLRKRFVALALGKARRKILAGKIKSSKTCLI